MSDTTPKRSAEVPVPEWLEGRLDALRDYPWLPGPNHPIPPSSLEALVVVIHELPRRLNLAERPLILAVDPGFIEVTFGIAEIEIHDGPSFTCSCIPILVTDAPEPVTVQDVEEALDWVEGLGDWVLRDRLELAFYSQVTCHWCGHAYSPKEARDPDLTQGCDEVVIPAVGVTRCPRCCAPTRPEEQASGR